MYRKAKLKHGVAKAFELFGADGPHEVNGEKSRHLTVVILCRSQAAQHFAGFVTAQVLVFDEATKDGFHWDGGGFGCHSFNQFSIICMPCSVRILSG